MLAGKYTTFKTVIDELYRDNDFTTEVPTHDVIQWIYDAMEKIAVPAQYWRRKARLKVENYRTLLPCDYHDRIQVAGSYDGCSPFPMIDSSYTFHPSLDNCPIDNNWQYLNESTDSTQLNPIGTDIHGNPVYELFSQGDFFSINSNNAVSSLRADGYDSYKINENYIFTRFKDGYVFLSYYAFPVDDEGFPLIPNSQKYIEAVKAYLRLKIDYKLYRKGKIDRNLYNDSQQAWAWAVGQAQNAARIPSIDQMENLKNQQKLIMRKNYHSTYFRNLGK